MAQIVIIGGGIAGLSVAAHLANHGQVTLIEAEDSLGYHASGRSAAMFLESYGNEVVQALNTASVEAHHAAGVLSPRLLLLIAQAEDAEQHRVEAASMGLDTISIAEAKTHFPILNTDIAAHAALRSDTYDLDTDLLMQHYRKTATQAGAEILTGDAVTALMQSGTGWRITLASGTEIAATQIVNAAGAWADEVAQMAGLAPLGITPYRRSMAVLPLPDTYDPSDWPFVDEVHERWYAKPQSGHLIVSPQEEDETTPHDAYVEDMALAEGLARYEALVTEPVTRVTHSWAGLRSFAPDRALVLGRDARQPSFLWCAGQGGYGFQTAPAAGQILAEIIAGAPSSFDPALLKALSPERFA